MINDGSVSNEIESGNIPEETPEQRTQRLIQDNLAKFGMAYAYKGPNGEVSIFSPDTIDIHSMQVAVAFIDGTPVTIPRFGLVVANNVIEATGMMKMLAVMYPGARFKTIPYTSELNQKADIRRRILGR